MRSVKAADPPGPRLVVSLWAKGIFALCEIIGGIAAFFVTKQFLIDIALWVTKYEFAEDPHDIIANYLLHSVQNLSIEAQTFAAFYSWVMASVSSGSSLVFCERNFGIIPVAIRVFGLFIAYQLYRYTITYSIWFLFITVIDVIVIGLIWHEWGYLHRQRLAVGTKG